MRENKTRIEKVKQHIKDNAKTYIVGGTCLVVGTGFIFIARRGATTVTDIVDVYKPVYIAKQVVRRGHAGDIIQCIETGEVFASQSRAADLLGISKSTMSRHINGIIDTAGGFHFKRVGDFNTDPQIKHGL